MSVPTRQTSEHVRPFGKMHNRWTLLLLMWVMAGAGVSPALAFDIIPTWDSSITNDASANDIMTTIRAAIFEYQNRIANPITVQIKFAKMTSGLGQSQTPGYGHNYLAYRNALASHATSTLDSQALQLVPFQPSNPVNFGNTIHVAHALELALGLSNNSPPTVDSTLSFNTSLCKLSPSGGWPANGYSLSAVVCHEIDEVLGTFSNLYPSNAPSMTEVNPPDLFRFDENYFRSFTTNAGARAFFYIPGQSLIREYNQDGSGDFGDWKGDSTPHVQDAYGTPLSDPRLEFEEMALLDAIGYTIRPKPVWLDPSAGGGSGSYFSAYNSESSAGANVEPGGAIMIKGSPTLHHSRIDASTYGKVVKLTSFNGTTRIVP